MELVGWASVADSAGQGGHSVFHGSGKGNRYGDLDLTVHSHVSLLAEVPPIPFRGLVHLRIALLLSILGRRGRVHDGRVHDRARGDAHCPGLQVQIVAAPKFFSDESNDEIWKSLLQAAGDSGIDPAIVYAMNKTGRIVTETNLHFLTDAELQEWNDAVD